MDASDEGQYLHFAWLVGLSRSSMPAYPLGYLQN